VLENEEVRFEEKLKQAMFDDCLAYCSTMKMEAVRSFETRWVNFYQTTQCHITEDTVAYLLKARTGEPKKQPLLANGSETTFVSRQRPRIKK
jgi:hypothetical protein